MDYKNNLPLLNIMNNVTIGTQILCRYRYNSNGEYVKTRRPRLATVVALYKNFCTVEHKTKYHGSYFEDICYIDLLTRRHRVYKY